MIRHGEHGFLFAPGCDDEAVAMTRAVLRNPLLGADLSVRAGLEAENWTWEAATMQLESCYAAIRATPTAATGHTDQATR